VARFAPPIVGQASSSFGFASTSTASTSPRISGQADSEFAWAAEGRARYEPVATAGAAAAAFVFTSTAAGSYTPRPIVGRGGARFGSRIAGIGLVDVRMLREAEDLWLLGLTDLVGV